MSKRFFYSKTFVRDLLLLEALQKTDYDSPKTSKELSDYVERRWKEIFPNESADSSSSNKMGPATISRHVFDMNRSKLYRICIHGDNKLGYYNNNHLFTAAEANFISALICSVDSISCDEKKFLLDKIKAVTDSGKFIDYILDKQTKHKSNASSTKKSPSLLPKVNVIYQAIGAGKKITFYQRRHSFTNAWIEVTASPEFISLKDNELYLTAIVEGVQKDFKLKLISHFKISGEASASKIVPPKQNGNVELKITFPESFLEKVHERFKHHKHKYSAPTLRVVDGEQEISATIYLSESEELYKWLRLYCDKIKIHSKSIREKLTAQLNAFIEQINRK